MSTIKVGDTHCKTCFHVIDRHSALVEGDVPTEGCLSVCAYCGMISVFDQDLNLREMTQDEMNAVEAAYPFVMKMLRELQLAIKDKISKN